MPTETNLTKLFYEHFESLYKYFFYKTYSKEEAEDLTSETFLALAKSIQKKDVIDNEKNYLFGIAKNIFALHLRKKYKLKEVSINNIPESTLIEANTTDQKFRDHIINIINQLPQKQSQILMLRLIERRTFTETCEILGKNSNYIKTTQKRAIKSLKKLLACTPVAT